VHIGSALVHRSTDRLESPHRATETGYSAPLGAGAQLSGLTAAPERGFPGREDTTSRSAGILVVWYALGHRVTFCARSASLESADGRFLFLGIGPGRDLSILPRHSPERGATNLLYGTPTRRRMSTRQLSWPPT